MPEWINLSIEDELIRSEAPAEGLPIKFCLQNLQAKVGEGIMYYYHVSNLIEIH